MPSLIGIKDSIAKCRTEIRGLSQYHRLSDYEDLMVNSSSVVLNWLATFISNFLDIIFMIRKFKILLMYHM